MFQRAVISYRDIFSLRYKCVVVVSMLSNVIAFQYEHALIIALNVNNARQFVVNAEKTQVPNHKPNDAFIKMALFFANK